jgi:hypothetical protein
MNYGRLGAAVSPVITPIKEEEKMIKVSVLYPNSEGKKFDMGYYCSKHMPMVQQ